MLFEKSHSGSKYEGGDRPSRKHVDGPKYGSRQLPQFLQLSRSPTDLIHGFCVGHPGTSGCSRQCYHPRRCWCGPCSLEGPTLPTSAVGHGAAANASGETEGPGNRGRPGLGPHPNAQASSGAKILTVCFKGIWGKRSSSGPGCLSQLGPSGREGPLPNIFPAQASQCRRRSMSGVARCGEAVRSDSQASCWN